MRRRGLILPICIALGIVVLIGAGLQGRARFTGIRWIPDFSQPEQTVFPSQRRLPAPATSAPVQESGRAGSLDLTVVLWVLVGIGVVIGVVLVVRWLARRPARTATGVNATSIDTVPDVVAEPAQTAPSAPVLQRGFARAIDALDSEREPHDAIVKAWLGVQDAAAESGIRRRAAETPTEFTSRILARVPADARAVRTLLNAYLRVRFGDHPVTVRDVAMVREALASLAESWDAVLTERAAARPAPPWERRT
jgi:hypothetical protein